MGESEDSNICTENARKSNIDLKIVDNMEFTSYTKTANLPGNVTEHASLLAIDFPLLDSSLEKSIEKSRESVVQGPSFHAYNEISIIMTNTDRSARAPSGYPGDIGAHSNLATICSQPYARRNFSTDADGANTAIPSNML